MLALDPFQATQRFQPVQLGAPGAVGDPDMHSEDLLWGE